MHSISVPRASVLGNIFFIFNFMPQYGYFKGIIGASWFMGVLVPLYLLFPLIFRLSQKVSRVIWLFIISLIISYLFRMGLNWLMGNGMLQKLNMYPIDMVLYGRCSMIYNLPFFVMGIITYHIYNIIDNHERHKLLGRMLLVLTVIAFIGLPNMSDQYLVNPVTLQYIIGLFFIPLTLSLAIHENRLIVNRFTVFMGKISYSLYLIHTFAILRIIPLYEKIYLALKSDWLAFICCYAMTVSVVALVSLFTYNLIEQPGARLGDFFNKKLRVLYPSTFLIGERNK
jgi:peptidoglycan/LPS O-acetylase OafA/YrhL